jgi:glycosyltransferase involved in cell wall biosynthesis
MNKFPLISVIVTTKNEENNIANCLNSVNNQTYCNIEIIVVDNNSSDNTKNISRKFNALVYDKGPERSAQRNYGIYKGKGKYVIFLDADMFLSEKVIEECVKIYEADEQICGLYIPEIVIGNSFWAKVRCFERSFYKGTVIDCVRFFPKKVFEKVNGFDTSMTGPEDWDFDKKIRTLGKTRVIKSPLYHNESEFKMKRYLEKKGYYSKAMDQYKNKWGRNDPDVKKQLGVYYRMVGVFVEKGKWIDLMIHPVLAAGMYWLRFNVALRYLMR